MRRIALLIALAAGTAYAQDYSNISTASQPYVPLANGTVVTPVDSTGAVNYDEGYAIIPLGFSFPYYGTDYTTVLINTNGLLILDPASQTDCAPGTCNMPGSFPNRNTNYPAGMIAPWWADLDGTTSGPNGGPGAIRYRNPSPGTIVIEFSNWSYSQNITFAPVPGSFSFSVTLDSSGTIQIAYGTDSANLGGIPTPISLGFDNETGLKGEVLLQCAFPNPKCTDADWSKSLANTVWTIGRPIQPDLVVPLVGLANMDATGSGLSFTVSSTLRNLGENPADNFYWRAYLSPTQDFDAGSAELVFDSQAAGQPALSLDGGDFVNVTGAAVASTLPPPGSYYVIVQADPTNAVVKDPSDVPFGSTSSYFFIPGVDLVASAIQGPQVIGAGDTVQARLQFFNQGSSDAGVVQYSVLLAAPDPDGGVNPVNPYVAYSGTAYVSGAETVDTTITFPLAADAPGGNLFWGLQLDPNNQIVELNKANNTVFSNSTVNVELADLAIDSVTLVDPFTNTPTHVGDFGQPGRLLVTYHNAGGADARNFYIAGVLSTRSSVSFLTDTIMVEVPVALCPANGVSQTTALDFTFPLTKSGGDGGTPWTTGDYYLFGVLDSRVQVRESNKGNNTGRVPDPAVLLRSPAPDYTVVDVEAPSAASAGEVIPVYRVLKNAGTLDGPAVTYQYYASVDDVISTEDIPLTIVGAANPSVQLAVGASNSATEWVQLPTQMTAGPYYIGVVIDPGQTVTELDNTNQAGASSSTTQVVAPTFQIATQQLPAGVTGRPYSFGLVAVGGGQGNTTWSLDTTSGSLPAGLTLGSSDGVISGTPSEIGVSAFTVVATHGSQTATARLVLRILPTTGELVITTVDLPAIVNDPRVTYAASLGAAGGVQPYTWSLAGGRLPSGISLSTDGTLSGSVAAGVQLGASVITVAVRDAVGTQAEAQLQVRVVAPGSLIIDTLTIPDALVNTQYVTDLVAKNADGTPLADPLSWTVASGQLPTGLSLSTPDGERGLIGGTPTVAGTFAFSVEVQDAIGHTDVEDFIIRVFPTGLQISETGAPALLHPGDAVSFQFSAGPGTTLSLYSGALPPGVSMDAQGNVGGTVSPTATAGLYNFVVQAIDANGNQGLGAFALDVEPIAKPSGCSVAGGQGGFFALLILLAPLALLRRRRAKGALAAAALLAAPGAALAQNFVPYVVPPPVPATYVPLTGGTPLTGISTFQGQSVSMPFAFTFFGQSYASVSVSQYGYLVFNGFDSASSPTGIPNFNPDPSMDPMTFVAPWWMDLTEDPANDNIRWQVLGNAPNRVFAVEWAGIHPTPDTSSTISFEALLYEGSNRIRFAYAGTPPSSLSGTAGVGIQAGNTQLDGGVSVQGYAGLPCTSAFSANCGNGAPPYGWPSNQAVDFELPPDLWVQSVGGDTVGYAGVPYRAHATLANQGGSKAQAVNTRFYISTSPTFDNSASPIGDAAPVDVDVGASVIVSNPGSIPGSFDAGTYFIFAFVDPDNLIQEINDSNNVSNPYPITIGSPTADLIVDSISAPTTATPGGTLAVQRTFRNQGNAPTPQSVQYTYFLSNNAVATISDPALPPALTLGALDAGASDVGTDSVTLPSGLAAGQYWIGVCLDYDPNASQNFTLPEISKVNNCGTVGAPFLLDTGVLTIVTKSLPQVAQYQTYGTLLQAIGGNGAYSWKLAAGALPAGMMLSASGELVGSPSNTGTFSFTAQVTSGQEAQNADFQLTVTPADLPLAVADQALPAAEFAHAYSDQLIAVGGKPPYQWSLVSGSQLPTGFGLSADGVLEGATTQAGQFPFSVQVTDSAGSQVSKGLSLFVVRPGSLQIATTQLAVGYLGQAYLQSLDAVGGTAPYSWSVVKFAPLPENPTDAPVACTDNAPPIGAGCLQGHTCCPNQGEVCLDGLCANLSIPDDFGVKIQQDPSGENLLAGTPQRAGRFAVTFDVTDAAGAEARTTVPFEISYQEALAITTEALPDAFVDRDYAAAVSHNGGPALKATFSVACVEQIDSVLEHWNCAPAGPTQSLPPGLALGVDGTLSGKPTLPSGVTANSKNTSGGITTFPPVVYSFLVKVVDDQGREDVRSLSIRVRPNYPDGGGCGCNGLDGPGIFGALALLAALRRRRS